MNPLQGALLTDGVARHDAADAHVLGGADADDPRERYAPLETAVEEDGTFEPLIVRLHEVEGHSGMHHIVDGLLVLLAGQQKLGQHALLQDAAAIDLRSHELAQLATQRGRGTHEALGSGIAVVNADASLGQQPAHVTFAAAYAAGDSDVGLLHCSMR